MFGNDHFFVQPTSARNLWFDAILPLVLTNDVFLWLSGARNRGHV